MQRTATQEAAMLSEDISRWVFKLAVYTCLVTEVKEERNVHNNVRGMYASIFKMSNIHAH